MSVLQEEGWADRMEDSGFLDEDSGFLCFELLLEDEATANERLAELRRVLKEELTRCTKFEMSWWCDTAENGAPGDCGTSACALGWGAILSPALRRAGLRLVSLGHGSWMPQVPPGDDVNSFFGLTPTGGTFLFHFDGRGDAARREAIRRIDALLAAVSR